jgi:hypothetical protein
MAQLNNAIAEENQFFLYVNIRHFFLQLFHLYNTTTVICSR